MKKYGLGLVRLVVGLLFIFSGLIKANDPLGLSYKMQEFFEVWNMPALDAISLWLSVLMIVFEILAGVAVLLGWRMQLFAWLLLLLIIFFTFLTGYAVLSGKIRECGCFGDCIPLQATGSFLKDLFLLLLILLLFFFRREITPVAGASACIGALSFTLVFSFSLQWYALHYLPYLDCLPFKKGASIPEKMKPPAGAVPDSTVISFVYRKNGKDLEFTADKMPADLDSTYVFVKRYDKLIRKGNAEPAIKDFSLMTTTGNDTTQAILDRPGYKIFVFSRNFPETAPSWNGPFSVFYALAKSKSIPVYVITSSRAEAEAWLAANGLARPQAPADPAPSAGSLADGRPTVTDGISVFGCDATAVKTAARADPTFYLIKNGTIINKWSYASLDAALPAVGEVRGQ